MSEDDHANVEQRRDFWFRLCESHYPRMVSYSRQLGEVELGEDIVHNTILKVLRLLPDPGGVGNALSYLLRSVHNTWVDLHRGDGRFKTISLDSPGAAEVYNIAAPEADEGEGKEEDQERAHDQRRQALKRELERLSDRERLLLTLHLEGYRNSAIAEKLGEDVRLVRHDMNKVWNRVHYHLKKASQKDVDEGGPRRPVLTA